MLNLLLASDDTLHKAAKVYNMQLEMVDNGNTFVLSRWRTISRHDG